MFGPDLDALETYAKKLEPKMSKVDGIEDYFNGVAEPSAEMDMTINQAEANRVGLTPVAGRRRGERRAARRAGGRDASRRSVGRGSRARAGLRALRPAAARLDSRSSRAQTRGSAPLASARHVPSDRKRARELLRENQQQMIAGDGRSRRSLARRGHGRREERARRSTAAAGHSRRARRTVRGPAAGVPRAAARARPRRRRASSR